MRANIAPDEYFSGTFVTAHTTIKQKLKQIKALVFDWDGVFNNGAKNIEGHSTFSEVDSMGINMARFSYYLLFRKIPATAILTGENNPLAFSFAKREHFQSVYYKSSDKEKSLKHFCERNKISPTDVLYVFDDILDLQVAKLAGLRFMVGRNASSMLTEYAMEKRLVDYITNNDGNNNAVREVCELILALNNNYEIAVENRIKFSQAYQDYIALRQQIEPQFFTSKENNVTPA